MSTHPSSGYVPEWTDGDKLRKVRRHLRLTQEEFAEKLGVTVAAYTAWESDRNRITNLKAIARRIKQMAGTPLWWWFDTEPPIPPDGGRPVSEEEAGGPGSQKPPAQPTGCPVDDDLAAVA
jgi:transcriptional regulator with XRE-family HTH domain